MPNLWLGNIRAAREKHRLIAMGVTHIVCCTGGKQSDTALFPNDFKYKLLQLRNETDSEKVVEYFPAVNQFIDAALASGDNRPCGVLIHCMRGVNRSGTMTIGYLMSKGHSYRKAFDYIKFARPILKPRTGFTVQLLAYEQRLGMPPSAHLSHVLEAGERDKAIKIARKHAKTAAAAASAKSTATTTTAGEAALAKIKSKSAAKSKSKATTTATATAPGSAAATVTKSTTTKSTAASTASAKSKPVSKSNGTKSKS